VDIGTRVLLCGWQVEQQICLNQGLGGLVVEDELLVGVCVNILGIELAVKGFVNVPAGVVLGAEQVCPGQWLFLTLALLLQHVWADEFGVWEGLVPVVHEDVVFGIVGGNVLYGTHLGDLTADIVGESDRGEDGYAAVLQADWKVSIGAARDGCESNNVPSVPRPPMLIWPKRAKGSERVTMSGVMLRMTMTLSGFDGMSLLVILAMWC